MSHERFEELLAEGPKHFTAEELAVMAEQARSGSLVASDVPHLARCRRCFAVFAEMAQAHTQWQLDGSSSEDVPADWMQAGYAIASGDDDVTPDTPTTSQHVRQKPRWFIPALTVTGAALALSAVIFITTTRNGSFPGDQHLSTIQEAMRQDSAHGLVHAELGDIVLTKGTTYRNGHRPGIDDTEVALNEWSDQWGSQPPSADAAYWLIVGQLSLSRLEDVRAYLNAARNDYPNDDRFTFLAAHLAYKNSELALARELLTQLREENPDDGDVLLNLGIVMKEQGDPAADELLREVSRHYAGTYRADRADQLLSGN